VFSPYYKDQAQKFVDGEFVEMNLNEADIKQSENVLILKPKK
jgi:penicillin amidase